MQPALEDNLTLIDPDRVLRLMGGRPGGAHRPAIRQAVERALHDAQGLIRPFLAAERVAVESSRHETLRLAGGRRLKGPLVGRVLAGAEQIEVMACTIGADLEEWAARALSEDPVYALALDTVGSIWVERLGAEACARLAAEAAGPGPGVTPPISPGLDGWPLAEGQRQVFALLGEVEGVRLLESGGLHPRKSTTLVVGLGPNVRSDGRPCDYCSIGERCLHREHYG